MDENTMDQLDDMTSPVRTVKAKDSDKVTQELYQECVSRLSIRKRIKIKYNDYINKHSSNHINNHDSKHNNNSGIIKIVEDKVNEEISKDESTIYIQDNEEVIVKENVIDDLLTRINNQLEI